MDARADVEGRGGEVAAGADHDRASALLRARFEPVDVAAIDSNFRESDRLGDDQVRADGRLPGSVGGDRHEALLPAGGERSVPAFRVVPQHAIEGFLRRIVKVVEIHLQRLTRGPELTAGKGLQRRIGCSRSWVGTMCWYGEVSAWAVNMLVIERAAARYRVRAGILKISWMVRIMLTWL